MEDKLRSLNYSNKRDFFAASSLLIFASRSLFLFVISLFMLSVQAAYSAQVQLIWDPPSGVPSSEIAGYRVYYGTASRNYSHTVDVGNLTDNIVANLDSGSTYYFAVTSVGMDGAESDFSNEASKSFVQQYQLTVNRGGTGAGAVTSSPSGISCPPSCAGTYNGGSVVTLTATPSSGSTFTGWSGGACSGAGICSISLNSNMSVTANFSAKYGVTVNVQTDAPTGLPILPPTPVYRFSLESSPAKFYTIYESEKDWVVQNLSYEYSLDGVAFYAYQEQQPGTSPVYRFSMKSSPAKFYTIYESEKDWVVQNLSYEYSLDGVAFYAYQEREPGTFPVYRLSLESSPAKFYTIYESEKDWVIQNLSYEYSLDGVAFYAYQEQ